jgi:hypothetical protein
MKVSVKKSRALAIVLSACISIGSVQVQASSQQQITNSTYSIDINSYGYNNGSAYDYLNKFSDLIKKAAAAVCDKSNTVNSMLMQAIKYLATEEEQKILVSLVDAACSNEGTTFTNLVNFYKNLSDDDKATILKLLKRLIFWSQIDPSFSMVQMQAGETRIISNAAGTGVLHRVDENTFILDYTNSDGVREVLQTQPNQ